MSDDVAGTGIGDSEPDGDGIITFDPTDGNGGYGGRSANRDSGDSGEPGEPEPTRRRRGRQPGSRNKPKEGQADLGGIDVATMIAGIHGMLAIKLGPHWVLDDAEAKQLDKAIKRVFRHQNMRVTQKQLDYAFATYVVATIYGTRIVTSVMLARQPQQPEQSATLHPFPQPVPNAGFSAPA